MFNVGKMEWRGFRRKSRLLLLGNPGMTSGTLNLKRPRMDLSGMGGSSRMRWSLLGWKYCWQVMKLWEDLKHRRLLNELDDMIASNGVDGRLDVCQHLDGDQFLTTRVRYLTVNSISKNPCFPLYFL